MRVEFIVAVCCCFSPLLCLLSLDLVSYHQLVLTTGIRRLPWASTHAPLPGTLLAKVNWI